MPVLEPYDGWTRFLEDLFFGPERAQQSVVLFVDDRALDGFQQISGAPGVTLIDAVRQQLGSPNRLLYRITSRMARWRRQRDGSAPPSLPLLALTVLAASRMVESDELDGHNYYGRLAPLLGCSPEVVKGHFDLVAEWWRDLDRWLQRNGGSRGISTIVEHPRLRRIGFPLSQALLRESDRNTLRRFFTFAGAGQRQIPGSELAVALAHWATPGRAGLSSRFRRLIQSPDERALLARLLEIEARSWDGVRNGVTRRRPGNLPMRLLLQPRAERASWVVEIPEAMSSEQLVAGCPGVSAVEIAGGRYLRLDRPAFRPRDLAKGMNIPGRDRSLCWTGRSVIPLISDLKLGGWVSTSRLSAHEDQWLLVADRSWPDLKRFLLRSGVTLRAADVPGLAGFKLASLPASAFDSRAEPDLAIPAELAAIWPETGKEARLTGGLMLKPGSGQRTYLLGGAPDLELPSRSGHPETVHLTVGGELTTLEAAGRSLPLADIATVAGNYTVAVGDAMLRFRLVEASGIVQTPETDRIGWDIGSGRDAWRSARLQPGEPGRSIRGALIEEPAPSSTRTIRTNGCSTLFLLGEKPGEVQQVQVPPWAPHADLFGFARAGAVEVELEFIPTWLVRDWAGPGERPKAKATMVQFSLPPENLKRFEPAKKQVKRWGRELARLASASGDIRWKLFVLRGRWPAV